MARLALVEKGVPFERRTVDIMVKAEQFEAWYTALNPKAVVPTLAIGDEIVTDTIRIVYRVDRDFDGPSLTPADPDGIEAMDRMMRDVMGLHYGVLMYSRRLDASGKSPTVVARGNYLREQRARYPERAEILDSRIAGNDRLQAALANPAEIARHVDEARALVSRIDARPCQRAVRERRSLHAGGHVRDPGSRPISRPRIRQVVVGRLQRQRRRLLPAHARALELVGRRGRRYRHRARSLAVAPVATADQHGVACSIPKTGLPAPANSRRSSGPCH